MVPTIIFGTKTVTKCFTVYLSSMVWTSYKVIVHSNRSFWYLTTSCHHHLLTVNGSNWSWTIVMVFTVTMSINVQHESTIEKFEESLNFGSNWGTLKKFYCFKESAPEEESHFVSAPNLYEEQVPKERVCKAVTLQCEFNCMWTSRRTCEWMKVFSTGATPSPRKEV
jgi:hypothetical protein